MRKKLFSALLAGCMVVAMGSSMVYAEADDTAAADEETLSGEGLIKSWILSYGFIKSVFRING